MKKIILSAALMLTVHLMNAQWSLTATPSLTTANTVGIGTSAPATKLHVENGAITVSGTNPYGGPQIVLGQALPSNVNAWGIENMSTGLNFWRPFFSGNPNTGNYFLFLKHSNGNVGIKTDNPTASLTVNGNMLIGSSTTSLPAGYKLYVETGILTEKVKVAIKTTGNWSDFVFDKNYKMPSLKEVETYINANKHLPGIPSAEDVVANGVDLGEMDARLLQKIEELTLYVIQLEKDIKSLKEQK
jgi:hypothetical protein